MEEEGVGNGVLARLEREREREGEGNPPWHRFSFMPFRFFIEGKLLPPLDGTWKKREGGRGGDGEKLCN